MRNPSTTTDRLQVIDGTLYYSPNCTRTLSKIPDPDVNGVEAARNFLPTRREAEMEPFTARMDRVTSPRWWSLAWGWTSFIPILPKYDGSALYILSQNPILRSTQSLSGYQLSATIRQSFSNLEQDLYQAAHVLSLQLQISVLKPSHPWTFGYRNVHKSQTGLAEAAQDSRDWFAVWIGLISFLIAETEEEQYKKRGFPALAIMAWHSTLKNAGFDPTWVTGLNFSIACRFCADVPRVGAFIDLDQNKFGDPVKFVSRLQKLNVPIWYRWKSAYKDDARFASLAPSHHQAQSILATSVPPLIFPERPILRDQIPSESLSADLDTSNPPWKLWLKNKEATNQRLAALETAEERASRVQRLKHPPTTSAKVFCWEIDDAGKWKRNPVGKRYRHDTLTDYTPAQKVYDPFANEWDCCMELAPDEFVPDEEGIELSDDEADIPSFVQEVIPGHEYVVPTSTSDAQHQGPSVNMADIDQLCALQADAASTITSDLDVAEEHSARVLGLYYGFTQPLTPPVKPSHPLTDKERARFLKFIGIPLHSLDVKFFDRPSVVVMVKFIERLGQGQKLLEDEFDLSREHRETMMYRQRLSSIIVIAQDNGKSLYMFDFGLQRNTTPWRLALLTATHALMVCRLPGNLDEKDIALYLVRRGIPFKTLQESKTLNRMPVVPMSSRLIPHRPEGYVFTKEDYNTYLEGLQDFLVHRRARAALLSGGYAWRLAMLHVSPHTILDGPTGWSTCVEDMFVVQLPDYREYIDDGISELELDLLCGLNECFTGNGFQTAKKSFFPLVSTYMGSGQDYGRWTSTLERFFRRVHDSGSSASVDETTSPFRQPLTMTKWRDSLRGAGDFRRAQVHIEKLASSYVVDMLKVL